MSEHDVGSKKGFCLWIERKSERKNVMKCLLIWLQLRSVLMYHFLSCATDSSDVMMAMAIASEIRVRVA